MLMRFTIEQRHLTDVNGKPVGGDPMAVSFHSVEAESADEAVRLHITDASAEVIGGILKFPGFQAVATMRNPTGVYTLQVTPASQKLVPAC
jgi:hypothetical protein